MFRSSAENDNVFDGAQAILLCSVAFTILAFSWSYAYRHAVLLVLMVLCKTAIF